MAVVKSQGTKLFYVTPGSSPAIVALTCPTGITGLGGAADQIDTTCLSDTGDRRYEKGLGNPGPVTVPFNVHKGDVSQEDLFALKESGETLAWRFFESAIGNTVPGIASDGTIEPVPGVVSMGFQGYVSDVTVDVALNDIWKGTLTIQRSGNVDADLVTP